jgi:hypothetical protein
MMLIVCFRLRYMTTKTMQGRMRLLHWEDKLQPELMFSVPSMIDSKRFYSSFFNCHYSYYYFIVSRGEASIGTLDRQHCCVLG